MIHIDEKNLPQIKKNEYEWPKIIYRNTRSNKKKDYYCLAYERKRQIKNPKTMKNKIQKKSNYYYYFKTMLIYLIWIECFIDLIFDFKMIKVFKNIVFSIVIFDLIS